jgi:hypothetical protein
MAKARPNMATAEEIRALVERAFEVIDAHAYDEDDEPDYDSPLDDDPVERTNLAWGAAREALRYAAAAAAQLGDPGLLPLLARVHEVVSRWNDYAYSNRTVVLESVAVLLAQGAPVDETVEALAEHHEPSVRAAVAAGLEPRGPREVAILERLASDTSADVRTPAKAALAKRGEVPWWLGKFESDPLARLSAEDAALHKEALEQVAKLLDLDPFALAARDEDLARAIGALPDPLAVEAARLALTAGGRFAGALPRLGAMMLSRPGGVDALLRVCEAWSKAPHFHVRAEHVRIVADAPMPLRLEACLALARYAVSASDEVRRTQNGPVHIAAEIAGKAFPPGVDITPLVDLALSCPETPEFKVDWAMAGLRPALGADHVDPTPIAARLVEAQLAGFPPPWRKISTAAGNMLLRLPKDTLRATAEAAVRSDLDDVATWGLARLLFEAHDPERDPEPLAMVRLFGEDPRLRRLLTEGYAVQSATVTMLREDLRRGALDFRTACHTVDLIDGLWGGRAHGNERMHPLGNHEQRLEETRAQTRAKFAAFLGPEALQGPVTEEEWAAVRRARDALGDLGDREWWLALTALPAGPWHPDDRAFLERAVLATEAGADLVFALALALADKPEPGILPLFQRLLRVNPGERDTLRSSYVAVRDALGLEPSEAGPAPGGVPRQWMDEPEDEDEDA